MLFMKCRIGKTVGKMYKENYQKEVGSRFHLLLPRTNPTLLQLAGCRPVPHASCGSYQEHRSGASTVLWFCLLGREPLNPCLCRSGDGVLKEYKIGLSTQFSRICYGHNLMGKMLVTTSFTTDTFANVCPLHESVLSWPSLD